MLGPLLGPDATGEISLFEFDRCGYTFEGERSPPVERCPVCASSNVALLRTTDSHL